MSAAVARPPTKVISSTTILPSQARNFLSTFILKADADRHTSSRGDLVLSDQRRIEQALQGVFIPKPVDATKTATTELNSPVVTNAARMNSQGGRRTAATEEDNDEQEEGQEDEQEEGGRGGGRPSHYALQDEVPTVESQSHSEEGKAKRKADKKQRLKEEKKQRAEARAKERQ